MSFRGSRERAEEQAGMERCAGCLLQEDVAHFNLPQE